MKIYEVLNGCTFCVAENNLSPYLRFWGFFLTESVIYQRVFSFQGWKQPCLTGIEKSREYKWRNKFHSLIHIKVSSDHFDGLQGSSWVHDCLFDLPVPQQAVVKDNPRHLSWCDDSTLMFPILMVALLVSIRRITHTSVFSRFTFVIHCIACFIFLCTVSIATDFSLEDP